MEQNVLLKGLVEISISFNFENVLVRFSQVLEDIFRFPLSLLFKYAIHLNSWLPYEKKSPAGNEEL